MITGGSQYERNGRTHYQRNKQDYMDKASARKRAIKDCIRIDKSAKGCVDCGITDWRVLDYDHLPEFSKTMSISLAITKGWTLVRLQKEIEKCEVVCANCHRIRTHVRLASIV